MTGEVLIVDNGSRSTPLIGDLVRQAGWHTSVVAAALAVPVPRSADAVILTGTDLPVFAPGYEAEIGLIRDCAVPLLGICGGMQLIGRAYGVGLDKGEAVIGATPVRLRWGVDLFDGLPQEAQLFQRHVYRLRSTPPGFEVTASSESCAIEGIRQAGRPLYGMQAHLEFRHHGRQILRRFLQIARERA